MIQVCVSSVLQAVVLGNPFMGLCCDYLTEWGGVCQEMKIGAHGAYQ